MPSTADPKKRNRNANDLIALNSRIRVVVQRPLCPRTVLLSQVAERVTIRLGNQQAAGAMAVSETGSLLR